MNPLLHQFLTEGRDFIEQICQKLLSLEEAPDDDALIGDIFRLVHTLKGNSGLFDLSILTRVIHAAEDLLDRVRDHEMSVDAELTDDLLSAMDFVTRLLDEIEKDGSIPESYAPDALDLAERLRERLPERDDVASAVSVASNVAELSSWAWISRVCEEDRVTAFARALTADGVWAARYIPEPECFFKGEDPILVLRNLPGRTGFSIQAANPWPPVEGLDIYSANLIIDVISIASREDLDEHVRYIPEQFLFYRLPVWALAMPTGIADDSEGVLFDFVETAAECIVRGDLLSFRQAVDALLGIVSPKLWLASALRWCQRLQDAHCEIAVISFLFDAVSKKENPDWHKFALSEASNSVADSVELPGATPSASAGGKSRSLDVTAQRMRNLILETQRQIVGIKAPSSQWGGRLNAVQNTLANLFLDDDAAAALLTRAADEARQTNSLEPLALFLDQIIQADSTLNSVITANEDSIIKTATVLEFPMQTAIQDMASMEPERRVANGNAGSTRVVDTAPDRGVRLLKVPQEKVDRLMDLIGEMVVAKNALPYLATRAEDHFGSRELSREIKTQYAIINRIAEEMQDGIMQVRMLPVGAVFQKFSRLVRDVSKQLGKKVRLIVEGDETEADKNVVESLGDPMIHILRNSLDHGLEMPEARTAAGKSEEGRLTVRAGQEGDRVVIEIEDDGRGIDPSVIKRKAFEKGLIDEQRLETISDEEAIQLVFAPGFSTSETVSSLSGRGVGMDVVKSSIEKVGGQVRLTSVLGRGTRIVLSLPLSMTVSNVMLVDIGGQNFGIPMDVVVETVRVSQEDIHTFKHQRTTLLRGRLVPLYGCNQLLASEHAPTPNDEGEFAVLVARVQGETVGIIVDGFAHTIDVILKPLEGPLAGLGGFAGSALLGDGSVLLVLNLKELF